MTNRNNQYLIALLASILAIGSWYVFAQATDDTDDLTLSNCEWKFDFDRMSTPGASTRTQLSDDGYLLNSCTGDLYRVVNVSGTTTAERVTLDE